MFVNIMAAIVAGGVILIVLLMLLMVFLGIQITNRIDDNTEISREVRDMIKSQLPKDGLE